MSGLDRKCRRRTLLEFRRFRQIQGGRVVFDVGWRLRLGRLFIRYNKQGNYKAVSLSFEYGMKSYRPVEEDSK